MKNKDKNNTQTPVGAGGPKGEQLESVNSSEACGESYNFTADTGDSFHRRAFSTPATKRPWECAVTVETPTPSKRARLLLHHYTVRPAVREKEIDSQETLEEARERKNAASGNEPKSWTASLYESVEE